MQAGCQIRGTASATGQLSMDVGYSKIYNVYAITEAKKENGATSVISEVLQEMTAYTPFNKIYTERSRSIETITEGDYSLTYTYGTDQQRKRAVLNNTSTGAVEKTIYYAGNYEEITVGSDVYKVHYISSPTGLTAIYVDHNGTGTLYYVYTDHLGSILTLTDASGTIVYEQNFDAWGRERNPTDWSYTANTGTKPAWLIRGFTGHEHLPEFALINMNGRCYDPILGRMLSPDNYVQSLDYSQGLNRYSYALNNPLVYTDPSGELAMLPVLGILFIASAVDNLLNYNQQGHQTVGDALTATVSDALNEYNLITSSTQVTVYRNKGVTITVGLSLATLGPTGSISYTKGDWTFGVSAGASYNTNPYAPGWEPRIGGGVSYYDEVNNVGFSAGITRFGGAHAQYNWMLGLRSGDFSITTVNDAWLSGDDYRTAALEFQYKNITAGFSIYTTGVVTGSETDAGKKNEWISRKWGKHSGNKGSYLNGQRLQSAVYLGYNNGFTVSRVGFDHPKIQDFIQNGLHQNWLFRAFTGGGSPYIRTDYGTPGRIYSFDSPYYPYSLY